MERDSKREEFFKDYSPLDIFLHIGEHICRFYEAGSDTQVYYLERHFPDGPEALARALPFALTALEIKEQEVANVAQKLLLQKARERLQLVVDKIRVNGNKPPIYPAAIEMREDRSGDASSIINAHNHLAPPGGYQMR